MSTRTLTSTASGLKPFIPARISGPTAIIALDLATWTGWFLLLFLFLRLPPVLGVGWVALVGGLFAWRYLTPREISRVRRLEPWASPPPARLIPGITLAALVTAALGQFLDISYRRIPFVRLPDTADWDAYAGDIAGLLAATLVMVAIGPVLEEVCFRGWIQGSLLRRVSPAVSIGGSSILFAAVHGRPTWVPYFFVHGVILGYAVYLTRSVWTGVALHSVHNAAVVGLDPLFPTPESIRRWSDGLGAGAWSAPVATLLCGLVLAWLALRARSASDGASSPISPAREHT